jgi:methylmalonyl-CoA mutase N-terminal domain/subunit
MRDDIDKLEVEDVSEDVRNRKMKRIKRLVRRRNDMVYKEMSPNLRRQAQAAFAIWEKYRAAELSGERKDVFERAKRFLQDNNIEMD